MPIPLLTDLLNGLTNASGFALFSIGVGLLAFAFWKRKLVMGWMYDQEVAARKAAEAEALAQRVELSAQRETIVALTAGLHRDPDRRRADRA